MINSLKRIENIKIGRIQFLLIFFAFSLINFYASILNAVSLRIGILIPTFLVLAFSFSKRAAQSGIKIKTLLNTGLIALLILVSFFVVLFLIYFFTEGNYYLVFYAGLFIFPVFAIPFAISIFFILAPVLFLKETIFDENYNPCIKKSYKLPYIEFRGRK